MNLTNDIGRELILSVIQGDAKKGNPDGQYHLGFMYLQGSGVLQDFTEGAKWLREAANQGHALA